MDVTDSGTAVLRVERGSVSDEELAAVTVALMALRAARGDRACVPPRVNPSSVGWQGWEHRAAYRPPRSWR